jgi:aldose 1-epimerase
LIGRYGNRIGHAQFTLDGKVYHLPANDGANTLHGGDKGFDKVVWTPRQLPDGGLELTYISKDGDEGFPGTLKAVVVYHLTPANELKIDYTATTDKDTVVNLTNHSYWNLKGAGNGLILDHILTLHASKIHPGRFRADPHRRTQTRRRHAVRFHQAHRHRRPHRAERRAAQTRPRLRSQLRHRPHRQRAHPLRARGRASTGRVLEVETTEPAVQFYTGNFLDGTLKAKGGHVYPFRAALCLETQHYPDSPNHPSFPSTELKPGQTYKTTTLYRFSVQK